MKMRRVVPAILLVLVMVILAGCTKYSKVYEDDKISAVLEMDKEGTNLAVDVTFDQIAFDLTGETEEELTEDGRVKKYEVVMSDGMARVYQDDTMDQNSRTYITIFAGSEEMDRVLGYHLIRCEKIFYPENGKNFLLNYSQSEKSISIDGAQAQTEDGIEVGSEVYILLNGSETGRSVFKTYLYDVSKELMHESYDAKQIGEAELFVDESVGKAVVVVCREGICYCWKLSGVTGPDQVRAFADDLE